MNPNRGHHWLAGTVIAVLAVASLPASPHLDRPPVDGEIDYAPAEGAVTAVNPPPFVWLPLEGVERYLVQWSRTADFPPEATTTVRGLDLTVHVPGAVLEPGAWFWRYGYERDGVAHLGRARAFRIADDAVALPFPAIVEVLARVPMARPRLYHSPAQIAEMRAEPQGRYRTIIRSAVRAAEAAIARNEPLFPEPRPWDESADPRGEYLKTFRAMRPFTEGMHQCALAYLYTGDPRFAAEARRRLLHFMTWEVDGPSRAIPPAELGMDIAERAPRTFDWIHDTLSEDERRLCLDVLARRIAQINGLHRSMPFESQPFSSHPGRMLGFAIEGSLALAHDVPEAAAWLEYSLRLLWSVYPAWGGEAGGWSEGTGYWNGYMGRITNVVTELNRLGVPIKDKPFFRNTGWFGFYVAYPGRKQRGFGDGFEGTVSAGFGHNLYRFASLYQNPYFRWSANRMGGGPNGPAAAATFDPDLAERSPADLPHSRWFPDVGMVAMHSDLAQPDDNVILLFKSSPYGSVSHDHANQNAFTLDAYGEALAISSGYYQAYGSPHHSEWIWQTRAHNSVLVDGAGQTPRSRHARGSITAYAEHGDWCYAAGDATTAYAGRLGKFVRHVVFLRPATIVMIDDLVGPGAPARFQWLLHARSELQLDPGGTTATVAQGDVRLRVSFLQPEAMEMAQASGWDPLPSRPDDAPPQFHLTAATREAHAAVRIVTVLQPHRAGTADALPTPQRLDATGGIAIAIGDDLVLWKAPEAPAVQSGTHHSTEPVRVIRSAR